MSGFLTPQGDGDDCCCNGETAECRCQATMTQCLFSWVCFHPRDDRNIPANKPHKIRLVKIEGTGDLEVVFETELASGSWIPPVTHSVATKYRLEVCCADPGYATCDWEILSSINLTGTASGCPTCTDIPFNSCQKVKTEGELRQNLNVVIELSSDTITCPCSSASITTPDWSGLWVLTPSWDGVKCEGSYLQNTAATTCAGAVSIVHSLEIKALNNSQLIRIKFQSIILVGGTPTSGRYVEHSYVLGDTGELLTPAYSDCEGLVMGEKMDAGYDYSSSQSAVVFGLADPGVCWYPSSYNPVVSVDRQ